MAEVYLSIQEAAEVANKSVQTIRRALKTKKLTAKRQKTPQGFNYVISQSSLEEFYKINNEVREHQPLKSKKQKVSLADAEQTSLVTDYASKDEFQQLKSMLDSLLIENQKDKESFMRFAKVFQERFSAMENQIQLLEAPGEKKKKWYKFW